MKCNICKKEMLPEDDCGGDCIYCMSTIVEDPDCIKEVNRRRNMNTVTIKFTSNEREDVLFALKLWKKNHPKVDIGDLIEKVDTLGHDDIDDKVDLEKISNSEELLEIGRLAIENALIEMRDDRIFTCRNNGFVIRERDGKDSSTIRFGPETGLRIGLKAIAKHIKEN